MGLEKAKSYSPARAASKQLVEDDAGGDDATEGDATGDDTIRAVQQEVVLRVLEKIFPEITVLKELLLEKVGPGESGPREHVLEGDGTKKDGSSEADSLKKKLP